MNKVKAGGVLELGPAIFSDLKEGHKVGQKQRGTKADKKIRRDLGRVALSRTETEGK